MRKTKKRQTTMLLSFSRCSIITLCLLLFLLFSSSTLSAAIPSSQRDALIALYNSTNGDSWTDNSGWKNPPLAPDGFALAGTENTWNGVTCDLGNTTVLIIDIENNNLDGPIPSGIQYLTDLEELNLRDNFLSGNIPSELGTLSKLEYLNLRGNDLDGSIPSSLGGLTSLWYLSLSFNDLTGSIPPELGGLSSLQFLYLNFNLLDGSIPSALGGLTNLIQLYISDNDLTGSIPPELGGLSSLEDFYFHQNELSGSLPGALGSLSNLEVLYCHTNQLNGSLPSELSNLTELRTLNLSNNQISGTIPTWLGDLTNLTNLRLDRNEMTGTIPPELGKLSNLQYLHLEDNQLDGTIPSALSSLSNLEFFTLSDNSLTGTVPRWLIQFTHLRRVDLSNNLLTGTITGQAVTGETTSGMSDFFDYLPLAELTYLDISGNQLSGGIPSAIRVLSNLEDLYLNSNMLTGEIPSSLLNLTSLTDADIGYNALYSGDPSLQTFLDTVDPGWDTTQTVAAENVSILYQDATHLKVLWTPITYTTDPGGYRILYSLTSGGPFTYHNTTANKTISEMDITLPNPNIIAYLVVQTQTDVHGNNQNVVLSEYSAEVTTADKPEINVRFGSTDFADGSSTNLGTRPANLIKNGQFVFTIENLGASPVLLTGVPIVLLTGTDADKFLVSAQPAAGTMGVGESTTFTLEADPGWADLPGGSTETVTLGISIDNNDADEHPYDFTITVTVQY